MGLWFGQTLFCADHVGWTRALVAALEQGAFTCAANAAALESQCWRNARNLPFPGTGECTAAARLAMGDTAGAMSAVLTGTGDELGTVLATMSSLQGRTSCYSDDSLSTALSDARSPARSTPAEPGGMGGRSTTTASFVSADSAGCADASTTGCIRSALGADDSSVAIVFAGCHAVPDAPPVVRGPGTRWLFTPVVLHGRRTMEGHGLRWEHCADGTVMVESALVVRGAE